MSLLPAPVSCTGFGIRLNKKPPEITFRKKDKGGINYTTAVPNPKLDLEGGWLGVEFAGQAEGGLGQPLIVVLFVDSACAGGAACSWLADGWYLHSLSSRLCTHFFTLLCLSLSGDVLPCLPCLVLPTLPCTP